MRQNGTLDVAIVGGGICGLTTAIALERRGIEPRIYEAATEYRPVGAGILLHTNAMLVFDRLGLTDRIRDAGVALDDGEIRSPTGTVLQRLDLAGVERAAFGHGYVAIHRAALQRVLLDALEAEVRTDAVCTAVDSTAPPIATFADGTTIEPDVLVGADGIDSTVREAIVPGVSRRRLESVVYRAVVPIDLPPTYRRRGFQCWGVGTYTGGARIDADRVYWFGTAPEPLRPESADPAAKLAAIREHYGGYPEPVPSIIAALEPGDVFRSALADVPRLERWRRGNVVLAGDAAHALLPFGGQGAAQGIEDAIVLARALATRDEPAAALDSYERTRKPRADRVHDEARRMGWLATRQSSLGARVRNLGVRVLPRRLFDRIRRRRIAETPLPKATTPE
ncbi:2-polyprenyl-6-methoxyphenol hydroxylase-like oxidoreductase [Halovivax ruber XH-70]|uniref:2-polyprenyl-6-methoxyphenol hydroxylase-like oxidoreductase n=1 Tax=Halovivax ruber (strain DSM 18193 / JCM 13892 / XH-70) TaxID=797302 RepID=L0I9I2_HALRX|nr:NAD(P)/FAD-dependent oxidoreductase [Halovivax ruber]AGB14886.1 2-polyprenyl-6-methoxyphenol hydroxylase-like oxidoreductase [Halovivax ruber XH-70]